MQTKGGRKGMGDRWGCGEGDVGEGGVRKEGRGEEVASGGEKCEIPPVALKLKVSQSGV